MLPATYERIVKQAPFHDEGHGFDVFGLQPVYLARAVEAARPLYERYFRVSSTGASNIPASGPAILVANHAGALPVDAAMLCIDVMRRTEPARIPRAIADHFVPHLPLISTVFARLGVVSGTRGNVRRLLERGELVAIWPEGVTGTGKSFRQRYSIQDWRVGFAELAIRHRAAVVPVAIIGAEESWPIVGKLPHVHAFGAPYLPIPLTPFPLPTRYHVRYGAPMYLGASAAEANDPSAVAAAASSVRIALEDLILKSLADRDGVFR